MKKKMIVLIAAALMALSTTSAFAFINAGNEIYRVVYDASSTSTFEAVTDLGSLSSLQALAAGTAIGTQASNGLTSLAGYSATNANLMVSYFGFDFATKTLYTGLTGNAADPLTNPSSWSTGGSILRTYVAAGYAVAAGTTNMTGTLAGGNGNISSFKLNMLDGSYASTFLSPDADHTTLSLAGLAAGTVTNIYKFAGTNDPENNITGAQVLALTTDVTTGITSIAPGAVAATPIPPAFFLMGSGLLGMVGLRRKKA